MLIYVVIQLMVGTMKRILFLIGVIGLLSLGCGGTESGKTEISWWQFWTSPEVKPTITDLTAGFEQQHPNDAIKVGELTWSDGHEKIAIALASGDGPDVIELGSDWVAEFAADDRLLDLTDKVGGLTDSLQMWEPASYEGKIFAVPWMLGTRVLFCNRTLLTAAGYPEDFKPRTWDELLEAAKKVNSLGEEQFGFGSNSAERHRLYKKFLPFFWTAGGKVFSDDGKSTQFDSPEGQRALEFYLALSKTGLIETQARLEEYFAAGQIAFVLSGEWLIRRLERDNVEFDYFVATMPGLSENEIGTSFAGGEYLVINRASKHPDVDMSFIRYLVTPENDRKFALAVGSFTPVNLHNTLDLQPDKIPIAEVFQRQLRNAKSTPVNPHWVQVEEILEHGIEQALFDKMTASQALQSIDLNCAKVLASDAKR